MHTIRSAPRPPGASMLVTEDGTVAGSVSGGCVEGAVYASCQEVMETGRPVLERYGFSDDEAFAVGLTCGGIIDVSSNTCRSRASRNRAGRRRHRRRPAGRRGDRSSSIRMRTGSAAGSSCGRIPSRAPSGWRRLDDRRRRRRPRAARRRQHLGGHVRTRGPADGHRHARVRGHLPAETADDRVRGHRLRGRGGPARAPSSASR